MKRVGGDRPIAVLPEHDCGDPNVGHLRSKIRDGRRAWSFFCNGMYVPIRCCPYCGDPLPRHILLTVVQGR